MVGGIDHVLSRIQEIQTRFETGFGVAKQAKGQTQNFADLLEEAQVTASEATGPAANAVNVTTAAANAPRAAAAKSASGLVVSLGAPKGVPFGEIIDSAADKYGLDADLIRAVIEAESGFRAGAKSRAGAAGLMQLMPATARSLGVKDPFDPAQNIDGGSKYLKMMLDRFGSVERALAAYNAGPGNVRKYGGVPPFKETQNYVARILSRLDELKG